MERRAPGALIDDRVRYTIRYAGEDSPFYRHWFNGNGINPDDIRMHEDLSTCQSSPGAGLLVSGEAGFGKSG